MDKTGEDAKGLTLRLSQTEFVIARQSLNEVTNGIRISDPEFVDRLGGSRSETRHLMHMLRDAVDTSGLPSDPRPGQAIGPEGMTIRLSVTDLKLLRNAIIEVTKGVEIEEWEFHTRLGRPVAEAKKLLAEVENLIGKAAG